MFYVQGNMDAEADEYNREKADCERVKDELQKKYEGTFSTTSQLETEVEQLRQIYTEKSEVNLSSIINVTGSSFKYWLISVANCKVSGKVLRKLVGSILIHVDLKVQ